MQFDPFLDRLSRDIRNDLAATIVAVLQQRDITPAQQIADAYLEKELEQYYQDYIRSRLTRYQSVVEAADNHSGNDIFRQAMVLWDNTLFFEVHELLEQAWHKAEGRKKEVLQALIRAAGVYIKLEYGYTDAAKKMADRALPVLSRERDFLAPYFDVDRLLSSLRDLDLQPPRLLV